jgi:hypothetical protein
MIPPMIPPATIPIPEPHAPPVLPNPKTEKTPAMSVMGQLMREHQVRPTLLSVFTRPEAFNASTKDCVPTEFGVGHGGRVHLHGTMPNVWVSMKSRSLPLPVHPPSVKS